MFSSWDDFDTDPCPAPRTTTYSVDGAMAYIVCTNGHTEQFALRPPRCGCQAAVLTYHLPRRLTVQFCTVCEATWRT